jgi:hypothetical protein
MYRRERYGRRLGWIAWTFSTTPKSRSIRRAISALKIARRIQEVLRISFTPRLSRRRKRSRNVPASLYPTFAAISSTLALKRCTARSTRRLRKYDIGDFPRTLCKEVDPDAGRDALRTATLNALSVKREHLGSLDRVANVVRVGVFLATSGDFYDQPIIANAASSSGMFWGGQDISAVRLRSGQLASGRASNAGGDVRSQQLKKRSL